MERSKHVERGVVDSRFRALSAALVTRRVIILGSTGSIGTQTLEVVSHLNALHERGVHAHRYEVVGLAAGRDAAKLNEQARAFDVRELALATNRDGTDVLTTGADPAAKARRGPDAAERLVREVECDIVVASIVGGAGLASTLAAVQLGRTVALANKEALVAAGSLVVPAAQDCGAALLPVDSEHAAVWQCLQAGPEGARGRVVPALLHRPAGVRRVILTASGGPFRTWTREQIENAPLEAALRHPTWTMGAKVTIDSASLMNKALEIIEAHWLFALPAEMLGAVVHAQSVAHALVEFDDMSVIAQLAHPDMRGPIQNALTFPKREASLVRPVSILGEAATALAFEPVDHDRFPLFSLGAGAIRDGLATTTAGAILNAANEEAVHAFVRGRVKRFGRVGELVRSVVEGMVPAPVRELGDVVEAERQAREGVRRMIEADAVSA